MSYVTTEKSFRVTLNQHNQENQKNFMLIFSRFIIICIKCGPAKFQGKGQSASPHLLLQDIFYNFYNISL